MLGAGAAQHVDELHNPAPSLLASGVAANRFHQRFLLAEMRGRPIRVFLIRQPDIMLSA